MQIGKQTAMLMFADVKNLKLYYNVKAVER
nr:MAG TPA: hypothetical protein [Caudoviricetes sp.]